MDFINQKGFQSTLPQGERRTTIMTPSGTYTFQSTLPQGERPDKTIEKLWCCYFNPRSRKGSDEAVQTEDPSVRTISIHAPARGATGMAYVFICLNEFQSTLPQGERRRRSRPYRLFLLYFNPRSRKGSDGTSIRNLLHMAGFQSTLPQGERLKMSS